MTGYRILHVAAEVTPLMKTGGLADVAQALPGALRALGHDARVLMPGYGGALKRARAVGEVRLVAHWGSARLLETELEGGCPLWLYETPEFAQRGEYPFGDAAGVPWADNAERFDEFARVAVALADDALGLGWRADVVHGHDWHAGLVPVHLQLARVPAASVFTIHNLAYPGLFDLATRARLGLPGWLEHWQALEFRELLSFIKGGLVFSDRVTTVSETYAGEICTPDRGEGLDGVLAARGADLVGIVNGIDTQAWDPAADPQVPVSFDADEPMGKAQARRALLAETDLEAGADVPVVAYVGRLAQQKGVDTLLAALDGIVDLPAVLIVLGAGEPALERGLAQAMERRPDRVRATIGFDEGFAHRLYAGADMLIVPSHFEPCGLSQLNAMRYGTIPVVHRTGGLAETVVDASETARADGSATGFQFDELTPEAVVAALARAYALFGEPERWRDLMVSAMRRDSSWSRSARAYGALYDEALDTRRRRLPP
ncbi:MAG: glycogen synthase GlgA [Halofilum sp. (in: g-proteobacteria)]